MLGRGRAVSRERRHGQRLFKVRYPSLIPPPPPSFAHRQPWKADSQRRNFLDFEDSWRFVKLLNGRSEIDRLGGCPRRSRAWCPPSEEEGAAGNVPLSS